MPSLWCLFKPFTVSAELTTSAFHGAAFHSLWKSAQFQPKSFYLSHLILLGIWLLIFLPVSKETTLFAFLADPQSAWPMRRAQHMVYKCLVVREKPYFSYCSSLPEVCWRSYPIFVYWDLWLETLPTARPLMLVCHSCCVDETLFIGGFSYEHHFPGFQLHLQNDRLQCALALHFLPGATCTGKKKKSPNVQKCKVSVYVMQQGCFTTENHLGTCGLFIL